MKPTLSLILDLYSFDSTFTSISNLKLIHEAHFFLRFNIKEKILLYFSTHKAAIYSCLCGTKLPEIICRYNLKSSPHLTNSGQKIKALLFLTHDPNRKFFLNSIWNLYTVATPNFQHHFRRIWKMLFFSPKNLFPYENFQLF